MRLTEEETRKLADYLPYTDKERFQRWAAENHIETPYPPIDATADSYFEGDRGAAFGAIEEYTLSNVENISNEVRRITAEPVFSRGGGIIEKITVAAMLKAQPREVSIRERYQGVSQYVWSTPHSLAKPKLPEKEDNEKTGGEPPAHYYPM